ncbi:ATP-binding cassette domain-containing protein [Paenarthrobacter sp. JL.01a]|uniref:ATP-binding cassette domain-containing protein n=1 Tax=Paenarthrobacter sp. JL.01a TaxID=2979324 RepID=UPI0021C79112|nr:sugar ABC transporter ATP-binding protein [Paenarthrobacter sp. JL.01a]UXM89828.1 sugar ABC transporter ATP-binding protein [Paenarthrobacter sp. JL.01a]
MDLLLHADGIHASYDQRRILKGVDLSLHRGEILGLIGTNGAGKSTLMDVLSGSLRHDSGLVTLAGEKFGPDSRDEAQACGVGIIPQNFRLDPQLTVAKAIYRGTFQADKSQDDLRGPALKLINDVAIALDPDALVGSLIRAEQALVEVLRMVAEEAQLVIMDEVAASLPDHDVATLHQVLRMLVNQGRAIIYITHRLDEVRSIAHRIAVLREGKVHTVLEASRTNPEELAFLLLEQKPAGSSRPTELAVSDEALRVADLSVGDSVRNISFSVAKGEIFGLLGTHQSGVHQILESLVGVRPATSGQLFLHGQPVSIQGPEDALRLRIGYLSEDAGAVDEEASIAEGLRVQTGDEDLKDEISGLRGVIDLVRRMRINTTNIHGTLTTLSGGDRQKVSLAKWMTSGCDVLIMSHPSRGIDIGAKDVVYQMLDELRQTGVAIILMSSDLTELVSWCHRIGVVRDGELVTIEANSNTNEDVLVYHMLGSAAVSGNSAARRVKS